tara:strand:- start:3 stop:317 length:315 start_codon:yes stop_codon:yes gene_type:complete
MNINNKHLATLSSVGTHIYVDGGRICTSPQLDEEDAKYVDHRNAFIIDWCDYDSDWHESLSDEDRAVFNDYLEIAKRQTKHINPDKIRNISPKVILAHNININY